MKETLLFDLDGTLTDSGEGIMNCAAYAFQSLGRAVPSPDALRTFVGPPLRDSFSRMGVPNSQISQAITAFRERYNRIGKWENTPYPGIAESLSALCRLGYRLCVATSKPEVMAKEILEHFALSRYFFCICGASMDSSRTTKEEVIAYLLEQIGDAAPALMIGDTRYDIEGAAYHGMPAVGVTWGYGLPEELTGAAAIAHSPAELVEIIQSR